MKRRVCHSALSREACPASCSVDGQKMLVKRGSRSLTRKHLRCVGWFCFTTL
jgi:hypothetical protein